MSPQSPQRPGFAAWLEAELERRRARNPLFSLRAFATRLEVSPAYLSRLISGKRPLTPRLAVKLADRLAVAPATRAWLIGLGRRRRPRELSRLARREDSEKEKAFQLAQDEFRLISDWYHYVIFCLVDLPEQTADPAWIARRLGITRRQAAEGLARMMRLGLLGVENGKLKQLKSSLSTSSDIPSGSLRQFHRQNLRRAEESLERDPPDLRDITSITVAVDPGHLPEAKRIIRNFRKKMARLLEDGEPRRVYTLAIQLFPADSVTRDPGNE